MTTMTTQTTTGVGRVARIIGPVVDVEFPVDAMPEIFNALTIDYDFQGENRTITLEVAQHIGDNMVRAISMKPTDGLVRGSEVKDTGAPDLGAGRRHHQGPRVQRDRRGAQPQGGREVRGHRALADPPQGRRASTSSTRRPRCSPPASRSIDLLTPYVQGGKIGLFGGAGVGKTVLIQELIYRVARELRRRVGVRRRRRAHP